MPPSPDDLDEVRSAIAFGFMASTAAFNGDTLTNLDADGYGQFTVRLDDLVEQWRQQTPDPVVDQRVMLRTASGWLHGVVLEVLRTRVRIRWDGGATGSMLLDDARRRLLREPRGGDRS